MRNNIFPIYNSAENRDEKRIFCHLLEKMLWNEFAHLQIVLQTLLNDSLKNILILRIFIES